MSSCSSPPQAAQRLAPSPPIPLYTLADLTRVSHLADKVQGESRADVAGQIRDVKRRDDFDDVIADDRPSPGKTAQEIGRFVVGDAAKSWYQHAWSDRHIERVRVEGDVVAICSRYAFQDGVDARGVELFRPYLNATVCEGSVDFALPRAADGTQANLGHAADPKHLGGAAHGAAESFRDPVALLTPVDVLVELNDDHWAAIFICAKDRNGDGMVAAEDERHGATIENGFHDRGCRGAIPRVIPGLHRDITAVDNADVATGEDI